MMMMVRIKSESEEDFRVVGVWISEEVEKGWINNKREREREEEEDRESKEMARVSVEDAL